MPLPWCYEEEGNELKYSATLCNRQIEEIHSSEGGDKYLLALLDVLHKCYDVKVRFDKARFSGTVEIEVEGEDGRYSVGNFRRFVHG